MELPDAAALAILERWPVADLATIGGAGRPHLVPIVFVRSGEALWSPVDGKPKSGRELVRLRNIRRDARVTLLLQHYDADWTRLWWLRVEGRAEVRSVPGSVPGEGDPSGPSGPAGEGGDAQVAAVAALRTKYPEYARVPVLGPGRTLLRIEVGRVRGWAASEAAVRSVVEEATSRDP